jgi:two-component system NtrC family response regulator
MNAAVILVVEDDPLQRKLVGENLESEGFVVFAAATGREAREIAGLHPVEIALIDFQLGGETGLDVIASLLEQNPLITPIMITAFGNIETAVEAMKRGAYDFVVKPVDFKKLLLVIERAKERHKLKKEVSLLRTELEGKFSFKNFIVNSPKMEAVAGMMGKAARSDATVLLVGETGTGKDLVAKTIHFSSKRQGGPFLAVNLPSLPETLVEGELFGAEKGAYTGAYERKTGKFEAASGGTLFLDEIGDLPAPLQVKILRSLQEKEYTRLGSSKPMKADVRIIAATNRDLENLVAEGKFRQDLYFRLNVIRIAVPPLRERKDDIPPLVDHFIASFARRENKKIRGISAEAMNALMAHPFPGNIRELENVIERAVVFCEGEYLTLADLPVALKEKEERRISDDPTLSLEERVRRLEMEEIRRALDASGGVKSKAARALGITERMLSYKIKIYGF